MSEVAVAVAPAPVEKHLTLDAVPDLFSEEESMRVAMRVRMLLVNNLSKGGTVIPVDPAEMKVLLAAANAIDKQAFDRKKIKNDDKLVNLAEQAKQLGSEILKDRASIIASFKRGEIHRVMPDLPDDFVPLPGQDEINPEQDRFENFRVAMRL